MLGKAAAEEFEEEVKWRQLRSFVEEKAEGNYNCLPLCPIEIALHNFL